MTAPTPEGRSAALPTAVVDAAVGWLVHLWSGHATDASRAEWQHWRAQDPLHEQAWRRIEATDTRLRASRTPGLDAGLAVAALAQPRAASGRRRALRSLSWLVVTGGATWTGATQLPWRGWTADLHTAKGEQRPVQLPDGSHLLLNTATALDVRYTRDWRRLHLHMGELLIATAPDKTLPARPFVVDTPAGSVRALGTRFTVRHDDASDAERTRVDVFDGAVELRSTSGDTLRLRTGESARLVRGGAIEPLAAAAEPAWAEGVLIASDMRLDDFVAELRRYRPGLISLAPEVAGLRLSGVFPLADTDRILQSLAQVLPVRVQLPVRHWVRIGPVSAGA